MLPKYLSPELQYDIPPSQKKNRVEFTLEVTHARLSSSNRYDCALTSVDPCACPSAL